MPASRPRRPPPLCSSTRRSGDYRKPAQLLRCAKVDRHQVSLTHSWADAATSAQLHTIPALGRAEKASALIKTSNLTSENNPEFPTSNPSAPTGGLRGALPQTATAIWGIPAAVTLLRIARTKARAAYGWISAACMSLRLLPATLLASWLAGILRRIGDQMFAMNDEEADWRGWHIQRRHAGLGRRYRDPVFDTLIRCPGCRGNGTVAARACAGCSGTGRIVLDQPPIPRDG
jgi:hypothetical protein